MAVTTTVDEVSSDLTRLRFLFVNLYLCGGPGSWVLIDAGLQGSAGTIVETAKDRFGADAGPQAIILTHGHFDHVGAFPELFEHWDVPVYAHRLELPHLIGQTDYPPPDPTVGRSNRADVVRVSQQGDRSGGARQVAAGRRQRAAHARLALAVHTPGHTAGHVSLFRDDDRCLIAGDAFVTTKQESLYAIVTQEPDVHGPPAYFTPDWANARRSVERLAALRPAIAATGHGPPMRGQELNHGLEKLVRELERIAVPDRGRYVRGSASSS